MNVSINTIRQWISMYYTVYCCHCHRNWKCQLSLSQQWWRSVTIAGQSKRVLQKVIKNWSAEYLLIQMANFYALHNAWLFSGLDTCQLFWVLDMDPKDVDSNHHRTNFYFLISVWITVKYHIKFSGLQRWHFRPVS